MLDINFGSAGDNNFQPWSLCSCACEGPQETWATLIITTLVECVNDKDEHVLQVTRKGADQIKEKRAFHHLWSKIWVVLKVFCYNGSERWEDHGKFVDEGGEDIYELAQNWVVPLAEKAPARWCHLSRLAQIEWANDVLPILGEP